MPGSGAMAGAVPQVSNNRADPGPIPAVPDLRSENSLQSQTGARPARPAHTAYSATNRCNCGFPEDSQTAALRRACG